MMNYFTLFNLPTTFEIEPNTLDKQLRILQSQHHPDVANNQNSERFSAVINQAYQTLLYPDSRASHLLQLVGQDASLDDSIHDLDFLDLAMDFRIQLDDADISEFPALQQQLQDWLIKLSASFAQAYAKKDWQTAIDATQKLKFLVKIDKDMNKKIDELYKADTSDDDLYV